MAFAERPAQYDGDFPEHLVAGGVAIPVVDLLEAVQIEIEQREGFPCALGLDEIGFHVVEEGTAVGQTGQQIMPCPERSAFLGPVRLGHVRSDAAISDEIPVLENGAPTQRPEALLAMECPRHHDVPEEDPVVEALPQAAKTCPFVSVESRGACQIGQDVKEVPVFQPFPAVAERGGQAGRDILQRSGRGGLPQPVTGIIIRIPQQELDDAVPLLQRIPADQKRREQGPDRHGQGQDKKQVNRQFEGDIEIERAVIDFP